MAAILASLRDPVRTAGGGAANAAKIAALLGVKAGFAGTVGQGPEGKGDEAALFFEAELRRVQVTPFLSRGKNPTGSCVILHDHTGTREIIASPGASTELSPGALMPGLIRKAGALVLDGYMLPAQELAAALLAEALAGGIPAAIDAGAPFIVRGLGKKLLEYATALPLLLFMNEEEAEVFTTLAGLSLKKLTGNGAFPVIVVKKEARGAEVYAGGSVIQAKTRPRFPLESTGAGDAFCGAFMSAWIQKRPLAECAALANEAAGLVLAIPGTAIDTDTREKFAALKEKYRL
jgi:ribokinase